MDTPPHRFAGRHFYAICSCLRCRSLLPIFIQPAILTPPAIAICSLSFSVNGYTNLTTNLFYSATELFSSISGMCIKSSGMQILQKVDILKLAVLYRGWGTYNYRSFLFVCLPAPGAVHCCGSSHEEAAGVGGPVAKRLPDAHA